MRGLKTGGAVELLGENSGQLSLAAMGALAGSRPGLSRGDSLCLRRRHFQT